jgi:hypothetical protein
MTVVAGPVRETFLLNAAVEGYHDGLSPARDS